ncbi:hypothetical protein Syun_019151 [Stephania yunnanensis]|uniref:5'-3' exoribonuclease n=1 Tax=Stephania yunnanensis TaxID=152371 RepID=A0AAP0ITP9_9MAGN
MGIPSFYRWLSDRYRRAVVRVIEEEPEFVDGFEVPIDITKPNPNGMEFDNLYLDMNGIIHPCFHPEGLPGPKSYEEVFRAVFKYIDRIFSLVRPRKLLYLAIDGVAPRAKMNQQRARRFIAAKEAADAATREKWMRRFSEPKEENLVALEQREAFDSNIITPGTEFMAALSYALKYYIQLRINTDLGWRGIKVILSDANVPGEGEHKIMSYIRLQRNLPGFDPNTRHCLYGLDGDLVMLALATHEVHFSILREVGRTRGRNDRHLHKRKRNLMRLAAVKGSNYLSDYISSQKFQFVNIWVLRDYLKHDMCIPDLGVETDLERLIDDFIFICIFVGNDFLPHVPSLAINEGAIELLMSVYQREFVRMGGYLTNSFEVDLKRVQHFMQVVGTYETAIFSRRGKLEKKMVGKEGWKDRHYSLKFGAKTEAECGQTRAHAVLKYTEGICWVMHYYYQGLCSWQWFYPYHYAPFASDFDDLERLEIHFTLGEPFKPFDQLMGVLPAASAHALPLSYRKLMTDASSPILDFYPIDFEIDMNRMRFARQAVCKLPFIQESRLLAEIAKVEHSLTGEEIRRNCLGLDLLFVHITHPLAAEIFSFFERKKDHPKLSKAKVKRKINAKSRSVLYKCPPLHPHIPRPAEGVVMPQVVLVVLQWGAFNEELKSSHKAQNNDDNDAELRPVSYRGITARLYRSKLELIHKKDVKPARVLWHEKPAVSARLLANSIPGSSFTKLTDRIVSEHYLEKKKNDVCPGKHYSNITGTQSRSNSREGAPDGEMCLCNGDRITNGGIPEESERLKRQKVESNSESQSHSFGVDNGNVHNDLSNLKETVLEIFTEVGKRNEKGHGKRKKRKRQYSLLEVTAAKLDSSGTLLPCQTQKDVLESNVEDCEKNLLKDPTAQPHSYAATHSSLSKNKKLNELNVERAMEEGEADAKVGKPKKKKRKKRDILVQSVETTSFI